MKTFFQLPGWDWLARMIVQPLGKAYMSVWTKIYWLLISSTHLEW